LIRALRGDGGVNYLEFELTRRRGNVVCATDIYPFISGERVTKTLRRLYLPLAANQSRTIVGKLLTAESDMVKAAPMLKELTAAIAGGKAKEALAIYDSLPPGPKKEKSIMLLRLQAAQASGDETLYLAAMDDLSKTFPNDPCVELTAIDAFVIRKEYDQALAAIDRLDKLVGGDPYLKVLRANALLEQGKFNEAANLAQRALDAEQTLRPAHDARLAIANLQKRYAAMAKYLAEYEAAFHQEYAGIDSVPEFAGFVASAEYKAYKAKNRKK
jgi:predicted Zn-dependent protease